MSLHARRAPLSGPAAVAVHDDRDVARQLREIDLVDELALEGAGGRQQFDIDHADSVLPYQTLTSVSPRAAAFADNRRRSPVSSSSATRSGGTRPRAASASTPQIERTMPRRNPSPRKSADSSGPSSSTVTEWSVRMVDSSADRSTAKTPKSRVPTARFAAARMRGRLAPAESGAAKGARRGGITSERHHR